ncbi:DUF1878 family protein [Neobacillus kokaensis]|uniref:DUF1878 domain-containing protein n=1 Tax=Neobacillus kokaensis TaxID=2759023 RepID=A0ABQ3N3W4_9BACI|nr:DUF1878 family protein [Neobacillus kokaensis]GHH98550.1 hypothetical protein AM1BK_20930 [Neobacillus kokaensis]
MCENNIQILMEKIQLLEFHQGLLLKLIQNPNLDFYRLIVENGKSKQEMETFFDLCDELSLKLEKQKAEGFVYFYPLLVEFVAALPDGLELHHVTKACLTQKLYEPLFQEFSKYL